MDGAEHKETWNLMDGVEHKETWYLMDGAEHSWQIKLYNWLQEQSSPG